jgi:hypothetical protein
MSGGVGGITGAIPLSPPDLNVGFNLLTETAVGDAHST